MPLIRKKEPADVHALSMPLVIDKMSGKKFGKSETGAAWLDAARTTATQMYQFWINIDDASVEDFLKIYTFLAKDEIAAIMHKHTAEPRKRIVQRLLAQEGTRVVHGKDEMKRAEKITSYLVGKCHIEEASDDELTLVRREISVVHAKAGDSIAAALVAGGLASSSSAVRRLLVIKRSLSMGKRLSGKSFRKLIFKRDGCLCVAARRLKTRYLLKFLHRNSACKVEGARRILAAS